jgi:hypothetical protein
MKRFFVVLLLMLGVVSTAQAVPPCWPGKPVNVATNLYLSPSYLSNWWQNNYVPPPQNVANQHYYVAFHATDQYCKARFGNSAWAVITGPYQLTNTVNGTIWGGVYFNCQKCSGIYAEPAPVDPIDDK